MSTRNLMITTKSHLPWENANLPCTGPNLWMCPMCLTINAWNYDDSIRASKKLGIEVKIATGYCFDNYCGGCRRSISNIEGGF